MRPSISLLVFILEKWNLTFVQKSIFFQFGLFPQTRNDPNVSQGMNTLDGASKQWEYPSVIKRSNYWYTKEHGWISAVLCRVLEANLKQLCIIFHSYGIPKIQTIAMKEDPHWWFSEMCEYKKIAWGNDVLVLYDDGHINQCMY
jgi:hypothetical protein